MPQPSITHNWAVRVLRAVALVAALALAVLTLTAGVSGAGVAPAARC
jgi:hypothetical protein